MSKLDIDRAPLRSGSRYPAPFATPCMPRSFRELGDAAGLTQFGVNLVTMPPGAWSSQRHWHELEDEFVWIVSGTATLVTDAGPTTLVAGDCAGFPAGRRDGHCLQNHSSEDVVFLVVGSRIEADWGEYSDIDMKFRPGETPGSVVFAHKDDRPY